MYKSLQGVQKVFCKLTGPNNQIGSNNRRVPREFKKIQKGVQIVGLS